MFAVMVWLRCSLPLWHPCSHSGFCRLSHAVDGGSRTLCLLPLGLSFGPRAVFRGWGFLLPSFLAGLTSFLVLWAFWLRPASFSSPLARVPPQSFPPSRQLSFGSLAPHGPQFSPSAPGHGVVETPSFSSWSVAFSLPRSCARGPLGSPSPLHTGSFHLFSRSYVTFVYYLYV